MARKIKKGSAVYSFLDASGILENGSAAEIEAHKKMYWASVRKKWKKAKLQECKTFTIFLDPGEVKLISQSTKNTKQSITGYIKKAALAAAKNKTVVDSITIGQIREAIVLHYNEIERMEEDSDIAKPIAAILLKQAGTIETKVLSCLKHFIK